MTSKLNPELDISYHNVHGSGWSGNTCQVRVNNEQFMSLGFPVGQKELTKDQLEWFVKNGDEVVRLCKLAKELRGKQTIEERAYFDVKAKRHKLLRKFCNDLKIKDS